MVLNVSTNTVTHMNCLRLHQEFNITPQDKAFERLSLSPSLCNVCCQQRHEQPQASVFKSPWVPRRALSVLQGGTISHNLSLLRPTISCHSFTLWFLILFLKEGLCVHELLMFQICRVPEEKTIQSQDSQTGKHLAIKPCLNLNYYIQQKLCTKQIKHLC